MIGTIDILLQAHNPNFPLEPVFTFVNSSQSFRIRNAPKKIGQWNITVVAVNISYPDNTVISKECVLTGGVWIATVDGCATSGTCENGFVVTASGIDEHGQTVTNYVLGAGDIYVKELDGTIAPSTTAAKMYFFEATPTSPHKGDAAFVSGTLNVFDGAEWVPCADTSGGADKLDGSAAYPAFEDEHLYSPGDIITYKGRIFQAISETMGEPPEGAYLSLWNEVLLRDLKQDALTSAQIGYINAVPSKADKVAGATAGNLASLTAQGNLADSGAKASDFAAKNDLPYRLVEPGKWEFSDGGVHTITGPAESIGGYNYYADGLYASQEFDTEADALDALMLDFTSFTATRHSLPGHLCDRSGNHVVVSGDTTLTLPAANPGYLRDFLVRLEISGSTVPTITFSAPTGETLTYETDGDEFPVPDAVGTWMYAFTETDASTFAVALKKVNEVAAPQAQGGV